MKGVSLFSNLGYHVGANKIDADDSQNGVNVLDDFDFVAVNSISSKKEETVDKEDRSEHWFLFCLKNSSDDTHNLVFELGPPTLQDVYFYPSKKNSSSFQTSNNKLLSTRDMPNPEFGFSINLGAGETQQFLFRVKSSENLLQQRFNEQKNFLREPILSTRLWDRVSYDLSKSVQDHLSSIFVGVFLTLMVLNLLVFIIARQFTSLLYVLWSSCVFMVWLSLDGRLVKYFSADHLRFSELGTFVFYPLAIILATFFFKQFQDLKNYPRLNLVGNVITIVSIPLFFLSFTYGEEVFTMVLDSVALVFSFYFAFYVPAYTLIKDGQSVPKYILISFTPLSLSLLDQVAFSFGITSQYYVPFPIVTGAVIAMIFISIFTILIAYREKQAAQQAAVEQLNISNTLKTNYNIQLEAELEQKTAHIKKINSDLEQKANKLLKMDESKSRFFANISHEFRTPLTLIEGPLKMLLAQNTFQEKSTIQGVLKNSNSLKNLIDQILLLSEIDEKLLGLKASRTNIVGAVKELLAQFTNLAEQKKIKLELVTNLAEVHAYVDLEKLRIIISNLLSNAIKFTHENGEIIVDIRSTAPAHKDENEFSGDEYVEITVSDTGGGIPSDEIPFVFDRYFQSDSSELAKSGVGTGIGLALVKELIELHAGEVSVTNISGDDGVRKGASFKINLPLGRAHLNDNDIAFESESNWDALAIITQSAEHSRIDDNQVTPSTRRRKTILVVDDNKEMRSYIQRFLENEYEVLTANDGVLAEEVLHKQLPDLIITDLMMPNRDGLEFVTSIKKQPVFSQVPVIMLTARAGMQDRMNGLMAAVDDYLVKPFNGDELKIRIRNLLNKQAQFAAFYRQQDSTHDGGSEGKVKNKSLSFIEKVRKVVNQRLTEPSFGVEELAKALHVSEATLRRRVAEEAQFTPAAFIRHCRLELARQKLSEGSVRSIAELTRSVGFSKPAYFASLYEKTFNMPIEFAPSANRINS
ncbi:hypothetical protein GCM10008090_10160 [Arenicella chitinivorans]|uniref:histidine kinase n=1 Tax=Arenicella chitinivorans TaxID=1329800 RepID=A0A918RN99_9GAMM|nr:response regulator [Arenicella chitinivorans]GHA03158.1 hypothetical protein GCM10008090_10160 [Arenicella chitinivorans]